MKYDDLIKIVYDALVAHGIQSHRISGDIAIVITHALDDEASELNVQRTPESGDEIRAMDMDDIRNPRYKKSRLRKLLEGFCYGCR